MKCDTRKCPSPPSCAVAWGPISDPRRYRQVLCPRCVDLVWEQNKRLVEEGEVEWAMFSLSTCEKGREK